jgi:hypothetical protein
MPVCKIQSHAQKKNNKPATTTHKTKYTTTKKEKTTGRVEEVPKYVRNTVH